MTDGCAEALQVKCVLCGAREIKPFSHQNEDDIPKSRE